MIGIRGSGGVKEWTCSLLGGLGVLMVMELLSIGGLAVLFSIWEWKYMYVGLTMTKTWLGLLGGV